MSKKKNIASVLKKYSVAFPSVNLSQEGVALYADVLQELDVSEIDGAMRRLLKHCKYFPTIAEIFEEARPNGRPKREVYQPTREELEAYEAMWNES